MNKKVLLSAFALILLSYHLSAQSLWKTFNSQTPPSKGEQLIIPKEYQIMQLDQEGMKEFLQELSTKPEQGKVIQIPNPEGEILDFKIWKTPMMEEALQIKYPNIQTFTAELINHPNITAKIDFTERGFHAMIFDAENTYFIDPYSSLADGYYTLYYKRNYTKPMQYRMSCEVDDEEELKPLKGEKINLSSTPSLVGMKQHGTTKKTYRLALSCTGEYAVAVAGSNPSKAAVLSVMVTTLNRVNGIYEREIAVTMTLIGNNDLLIYTNPITDPFTGNANNNGGFLLSLNQSNTTNVIGAANFDIGHIFSTGGGGIASLGSVCAKNQKAQGVTGSPSPIGDAYDVDYVAHEMGHQFGGSHIFNANSGSCNGNGNSSTAFESGSGSTIMSYAGICGANNLQSHSDAYFHSGTLDEISEFLITNYGGNWGGGAACGTSSTGAAAPQLASISATYSIPYKTPFELTSPVAVANGSELTYSWEQWDLGNFKSAESSAGTITAGPSLRTFYPQSSPTRVFPLIDSLLKGHLSYVGERLPLTERNLSFRVTARSIVNGWGTFNISDQKLIAEAKNTGLGFSVTSQNLANLIWYGNATETITWETALTNTAPINCANVNIYLSTDGGYTYPITLASDVPNTGTANITVPNQNVAQARVKVKGSGNIFFNISEKNFKIEKTSGTSIEDIASQLVKIYPNPAEDQINIQNLNKQELKLSLINNLGQVVWKGKTNQKVRIDVQHFSRGMYFLNIENTSSGQKTVQKIVLRNRN